MSWRTSLAAGIAVVSLSLSGFALGHIPAASAHSAAASNPLHLKHPGYLTVGSDTTYPPMESQSGGKFVGADIDLANALAKAMHLKGAKIVNNSFDTIIAALTRGNFDVIMSSMNDTPERRKTINFVDYMRASEGIVVKKSSSIHADNYKGMCGHSVAVETGTTEQFGLSAANAKCHKIDIHTYTQDTAAFQAFASGHAEAYSGDLPVCALYVKNSHGSLRLAGKPFAAGQDYGIGLPKSNKALKSALATALKKIMKNGQYGKILSKWGVNGAKL